MTTKTYWSVADIGELFGLTGHSVDRWRRRFGPDRTDAEIAKVASFPEPDVFIGATRPNAGWDPAREAEIRAWKAQMPGRGAGGGRPRKDAQARP
jgi:hypothetical protein